MTDFTTWAAVRTAIKNAIANHVAGDPCIGSFSVEGVTTNYTSTDELKKLYELTYTLESLDNGPTPSTRVSYGRHRRFA